MYVSTAWLSASGWSLLERYMRLTGIRRIAEAVRSAVFTAVVEAAQGRGLAPPEAEPHPRFQPQMGKLREVAVRLPSSTPLKRLQKELRDLLRLPRVSAGVALEWALATAIRVVRQRPAGLPEAVRDMLRVVAEEVGRAPRGERRRAAVQQLWLRMEAARRLAKELKLPVDRWWLAIIKEVEVSDDPLAVLRRYAEGGEAPRVRAADRFAEAAAQVLKEAGTPQGLRRLWWLRRGLLQRAADGAYERELVSHISSIVEEDPEEAWRLLEAAASGRRPATPPPPPFDRAAFYRAVGERLDTFDRVARRVLARARDVGLAAALYEAGEYFRGFVKHAEKDLKTMADKAPPEDREEDDLRRRLEAALEAARTVAAAGAAAGLVGREVEELTRAAEEKFLNYCRRHLGLPL